MTADKPIPIVKFARRLFGTEKPQAEQIKELQGKIKIAKLEAEYKKIQGVK